MEEKDVDDGDVMSVDPVTTSVERVEEEEDDDEGASESDTSTASTSTSTSSTSSRRKHQHQVKCVTRRWFMATSMGTSMRRHLWSHKHYDGPSVVATWCAPQAAGAPAFSFQAAGAQPGVIDVDVKKLFTFTVSRDNGPKQKRQKGQQRQHKQGEQVNKRNSVTTGKSGPGKTSTGKQSKSPPQQGTPLARIHASAGGSLGRKAPTWHKRRRHTGNAAAKPNHSGASTSSSSSWQLGTQVELPSLGCRPTLHARVEQVWSRKQWALDRWEAGIAWEHEHCTAVASQASNSDGNNNNNNNNDDDGSDNKSNNRSSSSITHWRPGIQLGYEVSPLKVGKASGSDRRRKKVVSDSDAMVGVGEGDGDGDAVTDSGTDDVAAGVTAKDVPTDDDDDHVPCSRNLAASFTLWDVPSRAAAWPVPVRVEARYSCWWRDDEAKPEPHEPGVSAPRALHQVGFGWGLQWNLAQEAPSWAGAMFRPRQDAPQWSSWAVVASFTHDWLVTTANAPSGSSPAVKSPYHASGGAREALHGTGLSARADGSRLAHSMTLAVVNGDSGASCGTLLGLQGVGARLRANGRGADVWARFVLQGSRNGIVWKSKPLVGVEVTGTWWSGCGWRGGVAVSVETS